MQPNFERYAWGFPDTEADWKREFKALGYDIRTDKTIIPLPLEVVKKEMTNFLSINFSCKPKTVGKDIVFYPLVRMCGGDARAEALSIRLRKQNNSATLCIVELAPQCGMDVAFLTPELANKYLQVFIHLAKEMVEMSRS